MGDSPRQTVTDRTAQSLQLDGSRTLGSLFDIKKDEIRSALEDFEAVEHRLEYVATVNGVRYVNDSKATNVNSTWYALESMTTSTVLILGGKDKGNDYSEIEELVKEKVKAIVCMGKDNEKLLDFFNGKVPVILDTHSMEDAVKACADLAEEETQCFFLLAAQASTYSQAMKTEGINSKSA